MAGARKITFLVVLFVGSGMLQAGIYDEFYVASRDGLMLVSADGSVSVFSPTSYRLVEVRGDFVYGSTTSRIDCYDRLGNLLNRIDTPWHVGFAALDNGGFALGNNSTDEFTFIDDDGDVVGSAKIVEKVNSSGQSIDAFQLGNALICAEDGYKHVISVDLSTYETSIMKDLSVVSGGLYGITYSEGLFYVCTGGKEIYSFAETSDLQRLAVLPEGNLTGLIVRDRTAYVSVNHADTLYAVNLQDGTYEVVTSSVDYPTDIEFVIPEPATLLLFGIGGLLVRRRN